MSASTKPWYESKIIWTSVIIGLSGVVIAVEQQFPAIGWLSSVQAALTIVLRIVATDTSISA
jgi:hypothetical protein